MKKFLSVRNIIVVVVVAIVIFFFYQNQQKSAQAKNAIPTKFDDKKYKVVEVKRGDIINSLTLSGIIDAEEKAELRFQTSGQLSWIKAKTGDVVKKWQALAGLDQRALRKQLDQDANNFLTTRTNFDDKVEDYKDTLLTDEVRNTLKRNQYTLNNSIISYELGEIALKYSTLSTPIDGIITNVEQPVSGINVTPANASISIINPKSIYFRSKIDQEDVNKIKVGDKATLKIDSYNDEKIDSKITYIAFTPVSGESSTVYQIKFEVPSAKDNQNLKYRIGMDGDVNIALEESKNALYLPIEAINEADGSKYVLVKTTDNKIVKKDIKTGIENDSEIEITQGLNENEPVIIKK